MINLRANAQYYVIFAQVIAYPALRFAGIAYDYALIFCLASFWIITMSNAFGWLGRISRSGRLGIAIAYSAAVTSVFLLRDSL